MVKIEAIKEEHNNDNQKIDVTSFDEKSLDTAKKYVDDLFARSSSELYEDMLEEVLCYDEEKCVIDFDVNDAEITNALSEIKNNWDKLNEDERKAIIEDFSETLAEKLGLEKIPKCNFYYEAEQGNYGFYSKTDNSINLSTNYLCDYKETVNTVAHELRHAYQYQRAAIGETYIDDMYKCNLENYQGLTYLDGYCVNFLDYYNQFVEAEARAFAKMFDI